MVGYVVGNVVGALGGVVDALGGVVGNVVGALGGVVDKEEDSVV